MRTPTTTANSPNSGTHPKTPRSADPTAGTSHGTTAGTSTPDPANTWDKPASTKPGLTQPDLPQCGHLLALPDRLAPHPVQRLMPGGRDQPGPGIRWPSGGRPLQERGQAGV